MWKFKYNNILLELSESMYNSDFKNISNIDISDVVINKMNDMYKEKFPEMKCRCLFK